MARRVLAVSHFYYTDNRAGGERYLHEILKELVRRGYEVDAVAVDNHTPNEVYEGVNVYKGPKYADMLSNKYDLVITQFEQANRILPQAKELGIPSVYIVHNDFPTTTKKTLDNHVPDLTVYNTHWIRNKMQYQHNSIVVQPPVYAEEHATKRGDKITFINLIPIKGVNVFYNMARSLPRLEFLGVKGGYQKSTQVIMRMNNIELIENTMDMKKDVWGRTKILLMPSQYDSYGMVAVEALASGIPVIARRQPGLEEALGKAGIFPRDNSILSWKNEIMKLQHPVYYEAASKRALERSAELDPRPQLEAFVKAVEKLL